ncbi:MAG: V-type ATP synthase subunit I [Candidatus Hadarchaeales archaeon]
MFRSQRMLVFRAVVPQRLQEEVVSGLHEVGIVEFRRTKLELGRREVQLQPLLSLLSRGNQVLGALNPPRKRTTLKGEPSLQECLSRLEKILSQVEPALAALLSKRDELRRRREEVLKAEELAKELFSLGVKPEHVFGSERVSVFLGRLEQEKVKSFLAALQAELPNRFWFKCSAGAKPLFVLACLREDSHRLSPILYRLGVEQIEPPAILRSGKPLEETQRELGRISGEEERLRRELVSLSELAEDLPPLLELLGIYVERLEASQLFGYTEATVLFEGWVQKEQASELREVLEKQSGGRMILKTMEVSREEVEEAPVLLRNPKVVENFELLTEIYGLPRYDELDPTPLLAFTFPLFFALCLGDAGYGLILGLLAYFPLGFLKETISGRFRRMLFVCAAASIPVGLLVGGFFGFGPLWVNPIQRPVPLIKLAIFLGVLHVLVGFLLSSVKGFWRGNWKEGLDGLAKLVGAAGFFGLCFSLVGIGLYEFGIDYRFPKVDLFEAFIPSTTGPFLFRLLFYSGLLVSIFLSALQKRGVGRISGPLNTVYGITGWISDVASYSRLMALCLATSIIGFTINYLLGMVYGSVVGGPVYLLPLLPLLALGFVLLHAANALLGTLGGFVHTLRLHFVEFFSKFYEGGGRKFQPFKAKRSLVEVKGW